MYKKILLPVDLGDESSWEKSLPVAVTLSNNYGAELHLLTVVPEFGMSIVGSFFPPGYERDALKAAEEKLDAFRTSHAPGAETHVAHGTPYQQIITSADDLGVDLIVLSAHRPEQSEFLLGPNAARVARHAKVSVLVVRG